MDLRKLRTRMARHVLPQMRTTVIGRLPFKMRTLTYCERCAKPAVGAHRLYCGKLGVDVPKFWAKMDKRRDGYWMWTRGKYNHGYGSVVWRFKPNGRGQMIAASRAAWMVARGPIPEGMHVLHRCDVPACCNPDHLFLGTHTENMRDMRLKERATGVTVTADQVRAIRREAAKKKYKGALAALARKYSISPQTVGKIVAGKTFTYIP